MCGLPSAVTPAKPSSLPATAGQARYVAPIADKHAPAMQQSLARAVSLPTAFGHEVEAAPAAEAATQAAAVEKDVMHARAALPPAVMMI